MVHIWIIYGCGWCTLFFMTHSWPLKMAQSKFREWNPSLKWWFSAAIVNYQRVSGLSFKPSFQGISQKNMAWNISRNSHWKWGIHGDTASHSHIVGKNDDHPLKYSEDPIFRSSHMAIYGDSQNLSPMRPQILVYVQYWPFNYWGTQVWPTSNSFFPHPCEHVP